MAATLALALWAMCGSVLPVSAQDSSVPAAATCPTAAAAPTDPRGWLAMLDSALGRLLTVGRDPAASEAVIPDPTLAQMVGQKLMVTMSGHTPSARLLARIRRGEIGGVVLLGSNITTRKALIRLTARLQHAAEAGGQPPLLIAVDQEGGSVKRVPWAPPTITVPEMGRRGSTTTARRQGKRTGTALRALGINTDLAPVADIPRSSASFMYQQGRTFSFRAARTARLADAFAAGLASAGVLATMKHFPGIGLATRNTDRAVETIRASTRQLAADLRPYRRAIGHDIPLIMLSNATYTAYDADNAAGWSRAIAFTLLRCDLGFTGVTITDSLDGTGHARGLRLRDLGLRAAMAGTDIILTTGSEKTTARLFRELLAHAQDGSLPRATLESSYDRIIALKSRL